jgi:cytochrome c5
MSGKPQSNPLILIWSIGAALILMILIVPFSLRDKGPQQRPAEDLDTRIAPVARFVMPVGGGAAAAGAGNDPAAIYASTCAACHEAGVAGAPKKGDAAAWAPRKAGGLDALVASATAGKGAMPPKGGATQLSDDEFRAVVQYISGT